MAKRDSDKLRAKGDEFHAKADRLENEGKDKLELSQKVTLHTAYFCMGIVAVSLVMNFILLWFNRQPMTQEFLTVVATYGGITSTLTFAGYVVLNSIRHTSLNKTQRLINTPAPATPSSQDSFADEEGE